MLPKVTTLGLSLSSACGADCVFCPEDRGTRIRTKVMPFEIAKKAIDDASIRSDAVQIDSMSFGENGDAYINKRAQDICRYARERIPGAFRFCTTDLQNLSVAMIEEIIRDELLHSIEFNIDGSSNELHFASKRLSIDHVNLKFPKMLELRERYRSGLRIVISVLPLRKYIDSTLLKIGKLPAKLTDPALQNLPDDTQSIVETIRPLLRSGDRIYEARPFHWAERGQVDAAKLDYSQYQCPLLESVGRTAYIAPNGEWYACCFDSNNELVLGSIKEQSLHEIAVGEPRRVLLERLAAQQFAEIGGPCRTVNCCVM